MESVQLISSLGPRFSLGDDVIRRFDKNIETALAYDNVTRVRALRLGGGGVLELSGGDNRKMVVVSSREIGRGSPRLKEPARSEYLAFATELHRRLAATGKTIKFVTGWIFKKTYDPLALQESILLA